MTASVDWMTARLQPNQPAPLRIEGRVEALVGQAFEVVGVPAEIGAVLELSRDTRPPVLAEVVGFRGRSSIAMPLTEAEGIASGATARLSYRGVVSLDAEACLGRVLDGLGRSLDGRPDPLRRDRTTSITEPSLLERARVRLPVDVGVRAINALQTIGRGSRIGLFAGSGVGKSTLLGQIARFTDADAIVVGLVGERQREVREFVEAELGSEALARSTVIVATSDDAPVLRRRAAWLASRQASALASTGRNVLLLMDSVSRFCAAQREIGLAAGEPPATRGYPPSVWSTLARLVEQAGTTEGHGAVTGIYTVLVEGDDMEDPVADAARSLLDGHIVLSRRLAERGSFPAIDPLQSVSRVMADVASAEHVLLANNMRAHLSVLADAEDLIRIGAYVPGNDEALDAAVQRESDIREFLAQPRDARMGPLGSIVGELHRALAGSDA
jgi:flagellum-specific ATP synthase